MKAYLGDSVYVESDGQGITLTTENGYGPSNEIYLEPKVNAEEIKQEIKGDGSCT